MKGPIYNDDYSACSETYATLRIYTDDIPSSEVTARLGVKPTTQIIKGKYIHEGERVRRIKRPRNFNAWFLSSEHDVKSCDSRRHIDWIVDQIHNKKEIIHSMIEQGFKIDITSFWVSESANGGPTLSPYQMKRLSDLNIEVWWDIYFGGDDED